MFLVGKNKNNVSNFGLKLDSDFKGINLLADTYRNMFMFNLIKSRS